MQSEAAGVAAGRALALAATAPSATADERLQAIPPHPCTFVIGAEIGFTGEGPVLLDYKKCVNVAGTRALSLNSHHEHVHFGRAGEALSSAGHAFIPDAPVFDLPGTDCALFLAFMGH